MGTLSAGLGQEGFNRDYKVIMELVIVIWIGSKRQMHRIGIEIERT